MPNNSLLALGSVGISLMVVYFLLSLLGRKRNISVKDKVVLITGASSGLGEACAHIFYKAGAKVLLCARNLKELQRVKTELQSLTTEGASHEPHIVYLDLADISSISNRAHDALAIHDQVDVLINNGGISFRGEVVDTSVEVDTKVMTVNYLGQVALTKALLPSMISRKEGHIIAISSVQGRIAIPFRSAYAASKFALQAFCDTLRAEVAHHNIHVGVLSPAYISTKLSLNAVTGDGSAHGVMDKTTASGMSPDFVASRVLQMVRCQEDESLLSPFIHKAAVYIRCLSPALFFTIMRRRAAKQRLELNKSQ